METNNKLNIQTEDFKEKLNNENKNNELIKIKLKEKIDENENLNNIIQKLQNENITTIKNLDDKYLIKIKNIKKQLEDKENQLKDLLDKNKSLEKKY